MTYSMSIGNELIPHFATAGAVAQARRVFQNSRTISKIDVLVRLFSWERGAAMQNASSGWAAYGFMGPFQLFTADDCRAIACHFKQTQQQPPANRSKDLALTDRFVRNLASHP